MKAEKEMKSKYTELNDAEMDRVSGGTDYKGIGNAGNDNSNSYIPSIGITDNGNDYPFKNIGSLEIQEKCEPDSEDVLIPHGDRLLQGQRLACSDPRNKGLKQACLTCNANK